MEMGCRRDGAGGGVGWRRGWGGGMDGLEPAAFGADNNRDIKIKNNPSVSCVVQRHI